MLILSACKSAAAPAPIAAPKANEGGCAAAGKEWFTPAGDAAPTIGKGCFTRCDTTACASGEVCSTVLTNPCGETEDGQFLACAQASTQTRLCLPAD
ncbi:MAG TPA: hypothetical protein VG755_09905 [Nannocystaceae bacterium]|nr:hypothetical protein [Nannocystaceae bacterium]